MVTTEPKPAEVEPAAAELGPPNHPVGPLVLRLPPEWRLTDDAFARLADENDALELERSAKGELIISPPPTGKGPDMAARMIAAIVIWIDAGGGGRARDGTGGFRFGGPATDAEQDSSRFELRAPDVSWISQAQLDAMDEDYVDGYPRFTPAFLVEIISSSQTRASQQRRMNMWMSYGVQLGWLIDPKRELVWIHRTGQNEPEFLERPDTLSGEDVMPDFTLDCSPIWS
jgi:Uma2 family endonuclease